ncbi:hypothetical protein NGM99_13630 [Mesorhizobium sp. RP14(2022)]|uniref:Transcriptional regulator n=1 Tax=Mesorhizobium liriopis TaxID=2953882 RepID=A0ABT1C7M3_9HYPH|nr:hypothetical protein [Mesorhizobium liriopis]MCO6050819.1 hypothetical protein [Mesorhizobium liriopis]
MPERRNYSSDCDKVGALRFMQSHIRELGEMAKAERFTMIAYLLEMAYIEVGDELRERVNADHATENGESAVETAAGDPLAA